MRKINDTELMKMIESGMQQKDVAAAMGVSPSAVNQRVKKLQAYAPPESFERLSDKAKSFVLAKCSGLNNMEAVKASYDVTTNESAKSMATVLMKDPDIGTAIQDLMAQEGITRRRRVQRLKDMIECPDLSVAGKGLDMSFKLTGEYAPQQIETVSYEQIQLLAINFNPNKPADADVIDVQPEGGNE